MPAPAQQQPEIPLAPLPDKNVVPNFDPSDVYFQGWLTYKDGEKLQAEKKYAEALEKFQRSQKLFDSIATYFPTWRRDMVGGRRAKVIEVIGQVGPEALKEREQKDKAMAEVEGGVLRGSPEKPLDNHIPAAPIKPIAEVDTIESRRIEELEAEVKRLQQNLAAKPAPANDAQREQSRAQDIARQRDMAQAELKRANDELAQLRARAAAAPMVEEVKKLNARIGNLEKEKAAMGYAFQRSQEETRVAKEQMEALNAERARLAQQVSDLGRNLDVERKARNEVIEGQQKQLRSYEEQLRKADAKDAVSQARIASLEHQLKEVGDTFEELKKEHEAVVQERDSMRSLLSQNEGSHVQTLIDKTMSQARELREAEETINRLNTDVNANQDALLTAMRDFALAKENINAFKAERAANEKRIADLESRLKSEERGLAGNATPANQEEVDELRKFIQKQLRLQDRRRKETELLLDVVGEKAKDDEKLAKALKLYQSEELPLSADELKLVQGHRIDDAFDATNLRKSPEEVNANVARLEQENMPYTEAAKRAYLQQRFESCRELFELVLERNPGDTETRCRLGNVQMRLKDMVSASDTFRRASELSTTNPYAHRMLGYSLLEMGDPALAIESLKKSVELSPTNPDGRVMLGRAYYETGQEEAAEEELKSAIVYDDAMHQAHYNLAYLYAKQGKKKLGLEYYQNALVRGATPDLDLEKRLSVTK